MIEATSQNRPKGSIPPIHSAAIWYDEGSVSITAHSGREGDTDDETTLNINISTIGMIKKLKGWKIADVHLQEHGNLYVLLTRPSDEV
jgi:hypothetical protein